MKTRHGGIADKAENPLLRPPYWSTGYIPEPVTLGTSKANLLNRLKECLTKMDTLCYDKETTLRPGEIFWPRQPWLNELSTIIRRLSSLYRRGCNELWSYIKALDNHYPALRLSGKITKLVDRATKAYYEPLAIAIQRQPASGNQPASDCFAALSRCRDGKSHIASEDWATYAKILRPRPARVTN